MFHRQSSGGAPVQSALLMHTQGQHQRVIRGTSYLWPHRKAEYLKSLKQHWINQALLETKAVAAMTTITKGVFEEKKEQLLMKWNVGNILLQGCGADSETGSIAWIEGGMNSTKFQQILDANIKQPVKNLHIPTTLAHPDVALQTKDDDFCQEVTS